MIWLKRALGEPFELSLATLAPLTGVAVAAAARSPEGALWPMAASVTDVDAGTLRVDGRGVGRVWPVGIVWMDLRLSRGDRVVHSDTFGIVVLDAEGLAEDARRAAAPAPGLGQRLVWSTDREMLDAICRRGLGAERHAAAVLDLNPGLAALGPILTAGVGLLLPEALASGAGMQTPVRLWGRA